MRILEILQEKDQQAYENIGDPSAFMNVYDIQEEEKITEKAIAEGKTAEVFDAELTPKTDEGEELMALFLGPGAAAPVTATASAPLSLYPGEYEFAREALAHSKPRSALGPGASEGAASGGRAARTAVDGGATRCL